MLLLHKYRHLTYANIDYNKSLLGSHGIISVQFTVLYRKKNIYVVFLFKIVPIILYKNFRNT